MTFAYSLSVSMVTARIQRQNSGHFNDILSTYQFSKNNHLDFAPSRIYHVFFRTLDIDLLCWHSFSLYTRIFSEGFLTCIEELVKLSLGKNSNEYLVLENTTADIIKRLSKGI